MTGAITCHEPLTANLPSLANCRIIVMQWSEEYGECYDCGLPAAYAVELYPSSPPEDRNENLCSVCAAHHAWQGERIVNWLPGEVES